MLYKTDVASMQQFLIMNSSYVKELGNEGWQLVQGETVTMVKIRSGWEISNANGSPSSPFNFFTQEQIDIAVATGILDG